MRRAGRGGERGLGSGGHGRRGRARRPAPTPDAIAAGLAEAIDRHEELRALGLERAKAFSWNAVARATVDVYREAAA